MASLSIFHLRAILYCNTNIVETFFIFFVINQGGLIAYFLASPPLPFRLLVPHHPAVQPFHRPVKEIRPALVLPPLDVRMGIVVAEHKKFILTFIRHPVIH